MAALTVTATNVVQISITGIANASVVGVAGTSAVTAGMALYIEPTTGRLWPIEATGNSTKASVAGIALHGALPSQPLAYIKQGAVKLGTTIMAQGAVIVAGATAGQMNPASDLTSTWFLSIIGYAYSPSTLVIPAPSAINAGVSQT